MTESNLTTTTMTVAEFRACIHAIWEDAPHVRIRVRPLGQMWQKQFSPILHITASGAMVIQEGEEMKLVFMNNVMQFEIESPFQGIRPNNHYRIA